MFPKFLAFIRHAESKKNRLMNLIDQDPSNTMLTAQLTATPDHAWGITPEGECQTEWVGQLLPLLFNFEFSLPKLYTSSHERGIRTSYALSSKWERPPCLWQSSDQDSEWPRWIVDPNLCERCWGTELSWRQFQLHYAEKYAEYRRNPLHYRPHFPGGESFCDLRNSRVERFIRRIEHECGGEDTVLAVTHYDWMLACRSLLENLDPDQFRRMYDDPAQQIGNLDILCYSRVHMGSKRGAVSDDPVSVALIHIPSESTSLDVIESIEWKEITPHSYRPEELITF